MKALIIADKNELYAIEKYGWKLISKEVLGNRSFYFYSKNKKKAIVVHSGIGLVNAAATTQILITKYQVQEIYNYGAVGASQKLAIYDLVIPQKIYFFDVETPWYLFGQTPQEAPFFKNDLMLADISNFSLASGNSFLNSIQKIKQIQEKIPVDIFDMESAAIAQICQQNNIKIFILKAVSDIIGIDKTDLEDINVRIAKAAQKALARLMTIF